MALEYAIEKLKETNELQDRANAAALSGVLASRGGVDIALPETASERTANELDLYVGSTMLSILDDAEKSPAIMGAEELDESTTERFALSDAAKSILRPYYAAASMKVPLAADNGKNWLGKPKTGEEKTEWQASRMTEVKKNSFRDGAASKPEYKKVLVTSDLGLTYVQGKRGNQALALQSQLHMDGHDHSREDPKLKLEFDNASVTSLRYTRNKRDESISEKLELPLVLSNAYDATINLNPDNLRIDMKYAVVTGGAYDESLKKEDVSYIFDPSSGNFHAAGHDKYITKDTFLRLLQRTVDIFIPTKQQ